MKNSGHWKIMKNFVSNFISVDESILYSGQDLFNLIATSIAFDQKVTALLHTQINKEDDLNFLSDASKIPGRKRFILDKTTLA